MHLDSRPHLEFYSKVSGDLGSIEDKYNMALALRPPAAPEPLHREPLRDDGLPAQPGRGRAARSAPPSASLVSASPDRPLPMVCLTFQCYHQLGTPPLARLSCLGPTSA